MELMYAYRESVEVANTKLVDLEKSKVSVSKISSKDSRYKCISQTGFASFDTVVASRLKLYIPAYFA